jgi:electron transport complex protein RnfE
MIDMSKFKIILNGIVKENPTFVLLLGMCPTLGTTSSAINGLAMGLATMFVLMLSNLIISCLKNLIPDLVRIPSYIIIIASLVTML